MSRYRATQKQTKKQIIICSRYKQKQELKSARGMHRNRSFHRIAKTTSLHQSKQTKQSHKLPSPAVHARHVEGPVPAPTCPRTACSCVPEETNQQAHKQNIQANKRANEQTNEEGFRGEGAAVDGGLSERARLVG